MHPVIVECSAHGEEIEAIIAQRLVPAIADLERPKVMLALMSFFIVLAKPDLEPEELKDAVAGASQWVALFLSETHIETSNKPTMN